MIDGMRETAVFSDLPGKREAGRLRMRTVRIGGRGRGCSRARATSGSVCAGAV